MKHHVLKIVEKPSPHAMEREPRYDLLLNGEPVDELYHNMTGYSASLPTIHGTKLVITEGPISKIRREIAILNRESKEAILMAESDPRKVTSYVRSEDYRFVYAASFLDHDDPKLILIPRGAMVTARKMFGPGPVGAGFFREEPLDKDSPAALLDAGQEWVADIDQNGLRTRMMTPNERVLASDAIAETDVFKTDNVDVLAVIGRDDESPEFPDLLFVSRISYDFARRSLGDELRAIDLDQVEQARISDPETREKIEKEFRDSDLLMEGDAAERHEREQEAICEGDRMSEALGRPLDAAERHEIEQMGITGVPKIEEMGPRGDTPQDEVEEIDNWVSRIGGEIQINFDGSSGGQEFSVTWIGTGKLPEGAIRRLEEITKVILSEEIGPDWNEGEGSSGMVRFSGDGEPWLDASSEVTDWVYERALEMDFAEWPDEDSGPTP